mmetsp:Transcript_16597/g.23316  ORF Transcript_16597/g.23316 Transcript_16597/m.23316 type:complete len:258 (+) Transcript_16597:428-1201(+)
MVAVPEHQTSSDFANHFVAIDCTVGEHTTRQTIVTFVGPVDDLINVRETVNGHDRPKHFIGENGHLVVNLTENGGLQVATQFPDTVSTCDEVGPIVDGSGDVTLNFAQVRLADLRALLRRRCKGVANNALLCHFGGFFNKLVVNVVVYKNPTACRTSFAVVPKDRSMNSSNCGLHIHVIAHNDRIIATEFHSSPFDSICRHVLNAFASGNGASEGDLVNVLVCTKCRPCRSSIATDKVDHAVWETGDFDQACDGQGC